jgi:hypothetical protein
VARLFEAFRHDHRHGLIVMLDLRTGEQSGGNAFRFGDLARIFMGDDCYDPGRLARFGQVDRGDPSLGDRAADDEAIGLVGRDVVPLIGIRCRSGHLEPAFDPVGGLADNLELVDRIGGCWRVEFHGSGPRVSDRRGERALGER